MAGREEAQQSPAFKALARSGRRVLALIEREVERGNASLSLETIMGEADLCRSAVRFAVKQVEALGFVLISSGARRTSTFSLSEAWRAVDEVEARRLVKLARGPTPPRQSSAPSRVRGVKVRVEVEQPPVERRAPSLAQLAWLGDGR